MNTLCNLYNLPSAAVTNWRDSSLCRFTAATAISSEAACVRIKGAPLRRLKPLSDLFRVRVCSCPLCI